MHRAFRGRGVVRTAVLVPWAIPTAVTALLWKRGGLRPRSLRYTISTSGLDGR
jgi:ABC-type sugar transport system permease subunit